MITTPLQRSIALCFTFLFYFIQGHSQIFVDVNASAGGDGLSWSTAYQNLQTALASATAGDEVWVSAGTYTISGDRNVSFNIPSGVALYGGFNGIETQRSERDWQNNLTRLDGQDYNHTVVYFFNSSSSTILDGFIVENGLAEEGGLDDRGKSGAGIYIDGATTTPSSPQIKNCIIQNHSSSANGGAALVNASFDGFSYAQFENCQFLNNASEADGGAIYLNGAFDGTCNVAFRDCLFEDNTTMQSGGAVFCMGQAGNATSTFERCNFNENATTNLNGGAIYSTANSNGVADHLINNCRFYKNSALAAGGIYNNAGSGSASPTITNCTFYGNMVDSGGGGQGGAIYNNGSGGGVSNTVITNCIIWGNEGLYNTNVLKNVNCSPYISHSIVDAEDCDAMQKVEEGSDLTCGPGMQYNIDPIFVDEINGDLHLSATSPAIDAGLIGSPYGFQDLDLNPREVGTVDLGAYEFTTVLPIEMAYFKAQQKNKLAELTWATFSEDQNAYFVVERSTDGSNFSPIFRISGAGTSETMNVYTTQDLRPLAGYNYYRIKDVAFDGRASYSPIRSLYFETAEVELFPNPVHDHLQLQLNEDHAYGEVHYFIYSIHGELLFAGLTSADHNTVSIQTAAIEDLSAGQYIVSLQLQDRRNIQKRFTKIGN